MSTHNAAENIYLLNETNRVENVKSRVHFMLITFVLISYLQREHGKKLIAVDCELTQRWHDKREFNVNFDLI